MPFDAESAVLVAPDAPAATSTGKFNPETAQPVAETREELNQNFKAQWQNANGWLEQLHVYGNWFKAQNRYEQSVEQSFDRPKVLGEIPKIETDKNTNTVGQAAAPVANAATGTVNAMQSAGGASMALNPAALVYATPYFAAKTWEAGKKAFGDFVDAIKGKEVTTGELSEDVVNTAMGVLATTAGGLHGAKGTVEMARGLKPSVEATVDLKPSVQKTADEMLDQNRRAMSDASESQPENTTKFDASTATPVQPEETNANPKQSAVEEIPVGPEAPTAPEAVAEGKPGEVPESANPTAAQEAPVNFDPASAEPVGQEPGFITSLKNAQVDAERKARGLEPIMSAARLENAEAWDQGMKLVESDPGYPQRLVEEVTRKPRAITPVENAVLLQDKITKKNEFELAEDQLVQASDSTDPEAIATAKVRYANASDALQKADEVDRKLGTESGRSLQARKMMADEDYSLSNLTLQKRAANDGKPLTPEQIAEVQKTADEFKAKSDALDKNISARKAAGEEQDPAAVKSISARIFQVLDRQYQESYKRLTSGRLFTISPQVVYDMGVVAAHDIAHGAVDFTKWSNDKVEQFGEKIRPYLDAAWKKGNDFLDKQIEKVAGKKKAPTRAELGYLERQKANLERAIAEKEKRLAENDVEARKKKADRPAHPTLEELKQTRDSLNEQIVTERTAKNADKVVADRLKRELDSLNEQIAAREKRVADKDVSALTSDPSINRPAQPEIEQAKQRLEALRKEIVELRKKPSDQKAAEAAERRLEAMKESIAEKQKKISSGNVAAEPAEVNRPLPPDLEQAKQQLEALNERISEMRKAPPKPKPTPRTKEEIQQQGYKTRTENRIKDLRQRIAEGNFARVPRRQMEQTEETMRLRGELEKVKLEFETGLAVDRAKNRTWWEKGLNGAVKWRRGFVLSSLGIFKKLFFAAQARSLLMPAEDLVGAAIGKIPGISRIAEGAPIEGGFNLDAEIQGKVAGWTKGMKDAYDKLRTGQSDLDLVHGKKKQGFEGESTILEPHFLNYISFTHGALKAQVFRESYTRALVKLNEFYGKQGLDITDPMVELRMSNEAYKYAERQIFMQDNFLVDGYKRFLSRLNQLDPKTGKPNPGLKLLSTAIQSELPIVKVPNNIAGEAIEYLTGSLTGSVKAAAALREGVDKLSPGEKDLIMRELKKGTLGLGSAVLVGYLLRNQIGGFYLPGKQDKKGVKSGEMKIGDYTVPEEDLHSPYIEAIMYGATVGRAADAKIRKSDKEPQGLVNGIMAASLGLAETSPFFREAIDLSEMRDPANRQRIVGQRVQSYVVPGAMSWIARKTDTNSKGEEIKRDPKTIPEHIKSGVPGLREDLKVKKGSPKPDRK